MRNPYWTSGSELEVKVPVQINTVQYKVEYLYSVYRTGTKIVFDSHAGWLKKMEVEESA